MHTAQPSPVLCPTRAPEVRQHVQLNLAVVRRQEHAPGGGHQRGTHVGFTQPARRAGGDGGMAAWAGRNAGGAHTRGAAQPAPVPTAGVLSSVSAAPPGSSRQVPILYTAQAGTPAKPVVSAAADALPFFGTATGQQAAQLVGLGHALKVGFVHGQPACRWHTGGDGVGEQQARHA